MLLKNIYFLLVTQEDADQIAKNVLELQKQFETFKLDLTKNVGEMFDIFGNGVVTLDGMMTLYFDMYGHLDGTLRELVRNKMASLFKTTCKQSCQAGT